MFSSSRYAMIHWFFIAAVARNNLFSGALPMAYVPAAVPFFEGRSSNSSYDIFDSLLVDIWYPVESNETDVPEAELSQLAAFAASQELIELMAMNGDTDISEFQAVEDIEDLIDIIEETFNITINSTDFGNFTIPTNLTDLCVLIPEEYEDLCDLLEPQPVRNGTFPLIIYSHDDGTLGAESVSFLASLAALGFFVVATNHIGDTGLDNVDPDDVSFFNRPRDVSAVIDYMLTNSTFVDSIDSQSIGVMGRGHGGLTAYAMAGGYGDFPGDDRVKAIVSVAGLSTPMTDSEIENIDVPLLLLGGTLDTVTPIEDNTVRVWENSNSVNAYRVDVIGAVHNSFTSICGILTALNTTLELLPENITDSIIYDIILDIEDIFIEYGDGVCPDTAPEEVLDFTAVQTISISYINSFFKVFLDDGGAAFKFILTPAYARFLPVIFDSQIITKSPTPLPTSSFSPTKDTCDDECASDNSLLRCFKLRCKACPFCAPTTSPTEPPTHSPTTAAPSITTGPTITDSFMPSTVPTIITLSPTVDKCDDECATDGSRFRCSKPKCKACSFCAPTLEPTDLPTSTPTTNPSFVPTSSLIPTVLVTSSPTNANASVMKVDRIRVLQRNKSRDRYQPSIKLWLTDGDDANLRQATVVMAWQTATAAETIEETTPNNGEVTFKFPTFDDGETVAISLISITKEGFEYRPNQNVEENDCPVFSTGCPTIEFS